MAKKKRPAGAGAGKVAEGYTHPDKTLPMRPEVGTQAQFRKKKPPVTYRYDSSLSPALEWDGQNPAREQGEELIRKILDAADVETAQNAARELKALSKPFLNWAGKAERLSFDVPTLPLFVHERLSTKAIVETLVGHKTDKQVDMWDLFGDPHHSFTDQVLRAYEHSDKWVNRLILGDSLVVMNSLLHYERLGGLPEIKVHRVTKINKSPNHEMTHSTYEVELVGLDTFDPTTMDTDKRDGNDVPCWMLDADYNTLCFRATQVFFPRTGAWESLKKALKADYDETVWDHLAGTRSAPFEAGEQKQIAVKVIDDRGNELLVVKALA